MTFAELRNLNTTTTKKRDDVPEKKKKRYTFLPLKLLGSVPHATQLTDGTGGNGDAAAAAAAGAG